MALAIADGLSLNGVPMPLSVADNGDGTYSINIGADITLDPTNLATSAKQTTAQTSLTAIAAALGTPADAAYAGSGNASIISILKGIYVNTTPP